VSHSDVHSQSLLRPQSYACSGSQFTPALLVIMSITKWWHWNGPKSKKKSSSMPSIFSEAFVIWLYLQANK
jgi:hypothetical protein